MRSLITRAAQAALLAMGACLMSGCSPGALSYFLNPETPLPAKLKHIGSKEKKVEPKVVILTYAGSADLPYDFINAEQVISGLLARNLEKLAKEQEEKLLVMQQRRVEEFKNANPDWRSMGLEAVGRRLGADYVIYLEINSLSLYEGLSNQMLYRGRSNINVTLVDVNKPDDSPPQDICSCVFPSDSRGPVDVGPDLQPQQFRQLFLTHVATQLVRYFSNFPRSDNRIMDPVF